MCGGALLACTLSAALLLASYSQETASAKRTRSLSPSAFEPASSAATAATLFAVHLRTPHFCLASTRDLALADLGEVAEHAYAVAYELLCIEDLPGGDRALPILICRDVEELRTVEQQHGVTVDVRRESLPGGFYPTVPMIAILNSRRTVELVAHEVGHWAIAQVIEHCPRVVDEGLAEYIESLVLEAREDCVNDAHAVRGKRRKILTYVARANKIPPLAQMFEPDRFRSYAIENYALAWCLMSVACEHERRHPGTLRKLLERLAVEKGEPWKVVAALYPATWLEKRWRERVMEAAAGE